MNTDAATLLNPIVKLGSDALIERNTILSSLMPIPTNEGPITWEMGLWVLIGKALKIGKAYSKGKPKGTFDRWCNENGFGTLTVNERRDTAWLVDNFKGFENSTITGFNHPSVWRASWRYYSGGSSKVTVATLSQTGESVTDGKKSKWMNLPNEPKVNKPTLTVIKGRLH